MNWLHTRLPLLSFILLPFFLIACNNSPPEPPPPPSELDTTSHNFIFEIDTLGELNSVLYDVAIINDTLAYAVGEMYLRDSTGQIDPQAWNTAKWNGQQWELKRIAFVGPCSAVLYPPLKAIWAFSENNTLVTNGGSIVRFDGTNAVMDCGMNSLLTGAINKVYAPSPQDVYAIGNVGTIVHYNGTTWQAMQSGTTLPLLDVFGRSASEVYAVGGDRSTAVVLKYDGTRWSTLMNSYYFGNGFDSTQLFRTQLYGHLNGTWADESGTLYVVGEYVYQMKAGQWGFTPGIADNYLNAPIFSRGFLTSIRGEAGNDFVTAGERLTVIHHNGSSGIQVGTQFSFSSPVDFYGVDMKGPFIVGVGTSGGRAIAMRLHR